MPWSITMASERAALSRTQSAMTSQSEGCMLELSLDIRSTTATSCSKPIRPGQTRSSCFPARPGWRPRSDSTDAMVPPVVSSEIFMAESLLLK